MKRKIYFSTILLFLAISGICQFVPINLNYQDPLNSHWPDWISIVDESNVWLGTLCYGPDAQVPYAFAIKTTDGGDTWEFNSIPAPGQPFISSLFAVDANTCFYVFTDNGTGGSIWKTSDGGISWLNKTTTQFSDPGAYADFYCAFDANEGVAVGDPTLGYFEIQRTADGGDTWSRVDANFIPPVIGAEMAMANDYSVLGDNVWFPSFIPDSNGNNSTRCFKSTDRGQNWTVSPIITDNMDYVGLDFSTAQKGVLWERWWINFSRQFYRTSDGGNTWTQDSVSINDKFIAAMSSVDGFDGGFVVLITDSTDYSISVLFTPDFFSTLVVIDSNLAVDPWGIQFKDAATGWLSGVGSDTNAIFKYNGLLTSIKSASKSPEKLAIIPNPTSTEALVKLPGLNGQGELSLMIYDAAGKLCENRKVESSTGWAKLNASSYNSGVYILEVVSGNRLIASAKWVVQH